MIKGFHQDGYEFLSNFYLSDFVFLGNHWPSVENAYTWYKTGADPDKLELYQNINPGLAKRKSRIPSDESWSIRKLQVMRNLINAKFDQNEDLAERLIATGTEEIVEFNTWGDKFYGMVEENGKLVGLNHLGILLMNKRSDLLDEGLPL